MREGWAKMDEKSNTLTICHVHHVADPEWGVMVWHVEVLTVANFSLRVWESPRRSQRSTR